MDSSLIALMMLSLFLGCGCWLLFMWAVREGQFTDIERPKHRMLDEEDFPSPRGDNAMAVDRSSGEAVPPLPDPPPPGEGGAGGSGYKFRKSSVLTKQ